MKYIDTIMDVDVYSDPECPSNTIYLISGKIKIPSVTVLTNEIREEIKEMVKHCKIVRMGGFEIEKGGNKK